MDYKLYKMDNYNIYFMQTKKFKTISLSLRFKKEKTKEDAVYASILQEVLKTGSKEYKNINDYYRARLNLYNPSVNIAMSNFGKDRTFFINSKFASEKYTEKGMNKKTIEFIFNILYNPKIEKDKFEEKTFDICRHDYIEILKAAKDDPFKYATDRIWEEMNIYDFKMLSNQEAIEIAKNMTSKDLYNYYKKLFTENSLDIFVVGDFNEEEMKNIIKDNVKGAFKENKPSKCITYKEINEKEEIIEEIKTNQSQLALGFKFKDLTDFERKYVALYYSSILGGGWSSKLFQTVREANSLCYYIGANRSMSHNTLLVYASIDEKNHDKTLKLIKQEFESMKEGDFTKKHMDRVKQLYYNSLLEMEDNQTAVMNNLIDVVFSNNDTIQKRRENIAKVTREDIINFAGKVYLETVYFLKGVKEWKKKKSKD